MDEEQAEHEQPIDGYAEITAAFEIIRGVRVQRLKLCPEIFTVPLYLTTALEGSRDNRRFRGENEILMKNVYYLGTLSENINEDVVQSLVDDDVFTADEGGEIIRLPTNKLRGTKMFAILVEKEDPDNSIITAVLSVLQDNENPALVNALEERVGIPLRPAQAVNDAVELDNQNPEIIENQVVVPIDAGAAGRWACDYCTFLNYADVNICEVCAKTKDFNPENRVEVLFCPACTLENAPGTEECEACGTNINPENIDAEDDDDEIPIRQFNGAPRHDDGVDNVARWLENVRVDRD